MKNARAAARDLHVNARGRVIAETNDRSRRVIFLFFLASSRARFNRGRITRYHCDLSDRGNDPLTVMIA